MEGDVSGNVFFILRIALIKLYLVLCHVRLYFPEKKSMCSQKKKIKNLP